MSSEATFAIDAEQAVLGGLMLDNKAWDKVADILHEEDFYRRDHRLIFRAIRELAAENCPFDTVTLSDSLGKIGQLDDVGGLVYLGSLANNTPTAANIKAYADIVLEKANMRRLLQIGKNICDSVNASDGRQAAELRELAQQALSNIAAFKKPKPVIDLHCGSDINIEPISWLWNGWLACGKLHILAGSPGTGKTTIALALAATVTTGGRWPDGSRAQMGNVLIWSGEDDPGDTLLPRYLAQGGERGKIHFVGERRVGNDVKSFDLSRDVPELIREANKVGDIRLIIVDPVVNAVTGDSHKNTEVRRALAPLVDMAAKMGAAVLGISHFSKGTAGRDPTERVVGSIAFGALARIVMAAAKPQEGDQRLLVRSKSNIGPDGGGFEYHLGQVELPNTGIFASQVTWGNAIEGEARELLSEDNGRSEKSECMDWLGELLKIGPVSAQQVKSQAEQAGFSEATLRRAKKELGIKAAKIRFDGGWSWYLPKVINDPEDAHPDRMSALGTNDHLRHNQPTDGVDL